MSWFQMMGQHIPEISWYDKHKVIYMHNMQKQYTCTQAYHDLYCQWECFIQSMHNMQKKLHQYANEKINMQNMHYHFAGECD